MSIDTRIERSPTGAQIRLRSNERRLCTSAGWKIACFKRDKLAFLFDPWEVVIKPDASADVIKSVLSSSVIQLLHTNTTPDVVYYLVRCDSHALLDPRLLTTADANGLADAVQKLTSQRLQNATES